MVTITHRDDNTDTAFAWEAVDSRFPAYGWGPTPTAALADLTAEIQRLARIANFPVSQLFLAGS